jgi:predicted secreted protein
MSNAIAGVGTIFRRWNGSSWDNISEVNSITGPGMKRDTIDVTSLDSTGGYKEFIAGFRDAGTVALNMNFTRSTYDQMKGDFESNDLVNYEIVLPDDDVTSLEFAGLVTECPLSIPAGDKVSADVTIQISGPVVVNSGSNTTLSD